MSFSQPNSPDPLATSNQQLSFNEQAAAAQNKNNSYNQSTPYGSLSYTPDQNSPSGYSINTSLSPAQQAILNNLQSYQTTQGNTANALASNVAGMYSQGPNIDPSSTTKQLQSWQQQYVQPLFNQQQSNLDAKLQNQGLTPGSEAFNNAQNLLARNQGDVTNQFFAQDEPLAFNQAVQQYQLPLQTLQGLFGQTQPTAPSFQGAPNAQIAPPNYAGAAQSNFTNKQGQFQNTISDLGQLAGSASNLASGIGSFSGGWTNGNGLSGALGYAQAGSNPFLPDGSRNPYYGAG